MPCRRRRSVRWPIRFARSLRLARSREGRPVTDHGVGDSFFLRRVRNLRPERRRTVERTEDVWQFAGVEAVQIRGVFRRIAMIEEVEERGLSHRSLLLDKPLRRPTVEGISRRGQDALLHVSCSG